MIPLTKSKEDWARARKSLRVLKGSPLALNAALERRYDKQITRLVRQMTAYTQRQLVRFLDDPNSSAFFAQDESISSQARILTNSLKTKFENFFNSKAKVYADQMVRDANKISSANVYSSLKDLSGGLSLGTRKITPDMQEIMKASAAANVTLIKSIPSQYMDKVQEAVMRSIMSGNGTKELVPYLKNQQRVTLNRARLIANTETKKVYTALNTARVKYLGVKKFEWIHSGGGREPRQQHLDWNGQIFSYDNPPIDIDGIPTLPSIQPNCRCVARPVIEFDEGEPEK